MNSSIVAPIVSPITVDSIVALCRNTVAHDVVIEVVEQTSSTNLDLLARVEDMPIGAAPVLLVALQQTAGRGRAGRTWLADGRGLTFSLAWPLRKSLEALNGLPLTVGVAIAEAIRAHGFDVALKWPNDVLLGGRKLAGVLVEAVGVSSLLRNDTWAIIGIGINIADTPAGPASIALPAIDRNILVATLLISLVEALLIFEKQGFSAFVTRWNALHAYAGQQVNIVDEAKVVHSGHALEVDDVGRLLLNTRQGVVAVVAGDVSLRIADPSPATKDDHATSC